MAEYIRGIDTQLSTNFRSSEFDCKGASCGCSKTNISKQLVTYLQLIRNHFGKPVVINSAFRCAEHNAAVGGVKGSKHLLGQAADIAINGVAPIEIAKFAESIGIKGIGLYDSFVHVDTRSNKSFWYGQDQERRTTFNSTVANKKPTTKEQSLIKQWQLAAIADGFTFTFGADGIWGAECAGIAKSAVLKVGRNYLNLNKLAQKLVCAKVDGIYGEQTKAAVRAYQKKQGLKADGIIGFNTWRLLLDVR